MLHILSHSPWQCDIDTLLSMLREGDDLLLIQDGVLSALEGSRFVEILTNAPHNSLCAEGRSGRARSFWSNFSQN